MDSTKRIDALYRNCKQMPTLTMFGFIIPLFLLFGSPLGFVYMADLKKLLAEIKRGELEVDTRARAKDMTVGGQIKFLKKNKLNFYVPSIGLIIYAGIVALIVVSNR